MPSLRIDLHLWAIRQTPKDENGNPVKDGWFWRTMTDEDGHSYPALFTSQEQASHYCRVLRSNLGEQYAFSYQEVGTVNLLSRKELREGNVELPRVTVGAPPKAPAFSEVEEVSGPGGRIV